MAQAGRYPSGSYLPATGAGLCGIRTRRFRYAAIEVLAPLAGRNERIGGSRAQHDLIEFTLLKAYLNANRPEDARRLLGARRPGASGVPVSRGSGGAVTGRSARCRRVEGLRAPPPASRRYYSAAARFGVNSSGKPLWPVSLSPSSYISKARFFSAGRIAAIWSRSRSAAIPG